MTKVYKLNKILYSIIFSVITTLIFVIDFKASNFVYNSEGTISKFFFDLTNSIKEFDIIYVTIEFCVFYFYFNTYFDGEKYNRKKLSYTILSLIFTILTLIGKSYAIDHTLSSLYISSAQVFKTIIFFFGYYFIYYAIIKKVSSINFNNIILKKKTFLEEQINNYPVRTSLIIITILWLPTIIISLPGLCNGDTTDILSQYFHQDTSWSIDTINLLNEDVYINKHHSVLHTVITGLIFSLGRKISSFTFGAILYTILQVALLLSIFSFMIKYMKKIKIPSLVLLLSILFIGLNPIIITHAICTIKDTPNAIFNLLYVIFLLQIVRNYNSIFNNRLRLILFIITILLVLLLRNNGIYTVLLSFPFLLLLYKNKFKKIFLTLLVPLLIFGTFNKIILPNLGVSDGSIKEVLTIPFMQLARVIKYETEDFTEEDKEVINKVLDFEKMKEYYDITISDGVKDLYNKDTTPEELKALFKVWFKYLKKHPFIYIESFICSTYGYFFPGQNSAMLYLYDYNIGESDFFDFNTFPMFNKLKTIGNNIITIYLNLPLLSNKVAYYDWLLIFSCIYIIKKKQYKYLIPLTPLLAVLLSCLASPVNGSYRYILPIIFSTPIIISIDYLTYKESKNNN